MYTDKVRIVLPERMARVATGRARLRLYRSKPQYCGAARAFPWVPFSMEPFSYLDVYVDRGLGMSPKTDALQGSLDLLVLKILTRRSRLHGYAIMSAIQDISGEVLRVEEGSLYPALHRMEEAGWIRAEWVIKENGRRARVYELTTEGKKQLGLEESRWKAVAAAVNRVLREA